MILRRSSRRAVHSASAGTGHSQVKYHSGVSLCVCVAAGRAAFLFVGIAQFLCEVGAAGAPTVVVSRHIALSSEFRAECRRLVATPAVPLRPPNTHRSALPAPRTHTHTHIPPTSTPSTRSAVIHTVEVPLPSHAYKRV